MAFYTFCEHLHWVTNLLINFRDTGIPLYCLNSVKNQNDRMKMASGEGGTDARNGDLFCSPLKRDTTSLSPQQHSDDFFKVAYRFFFMLPSATLLLLTTWTINTTTTDAVKDGGARLEFFRRSKNKNSDGERATSIHTSFTLSYYKAKHTPTIHTLQQH